MAIVETLFGRLWATSATDAVDWEAVYAEQLPRVYNFFRYRLGDAAAEDLTATTFLKAWTARGRYRADRAGTSTWLMAIARNVAVDHWRSRRNVVPLEEAEGMPAADDPAAAAEHGSDVQRLEVLLSGLPERERELVALKYGAEMTNRAIAELTGLSESNVGTLLHRTVVRLRGEWDREGV